MPLRWKLPYPRASIVLRHTIGGHLSKFRIRKSFTFEAAHQLETAVTAACHECIHGHSYKVEMFLASKNLNPDGMVLDFSELKGFKKLIMDQWDHGLILHANKRPWIEPMLEAGILKKGKVSFLLDNPTAEAMARVIYRSLSAYLADTLKVTTAYVEKVRVHETGSGWAEYESAYRDGSGF